MVLELEMEEEDRFKVIFYSAYIDEANGLFIGEELMEYAIDKEVLSNGNFLNNR